MSAKEFFSKGWPTRLAFWLGKYLPPWSGRTTAALIARILVTTKPDLYRAARSNLRHVLGPEVSEAELDRAVQRLLSHAARAYYEIFHNLGRPEVVAEEFRPPVRMAPGSLENFRQAMATGRGVCILGTHTSNFDLGGIALAQYLDTPALILSLADPAPGFEIINRLRQHGSRSGEQIITPITPQSLREAIQRLRQGGLVLTGVDRPIGAGDEPVEFFGATACLPAGYIRLPLMTDALVLTQATYYEAGEYRIVLNPPLEMVRTGDRRQDVIVNVRRVLAEVEGFVRSHPDQWMMFVPVWKEPPCSPGSSGEEAAAG